MDDLVLKIKELQEKKNLSTKVFAEKIGVTPQTLYDYFSGKTQISVKNLKKIANFFGVSVGYFFDGPGDSKKIIGNNNNVDATGNISHYNSDAETALKKENEHLKERLKDKEEMIRILKERNK